MMTHSKSRARLRAGAVVLMGLVGLQSAVQAQRGATGHRSTSTPAIVHDRVKPVNLDCSRRNIEGLRPSAAGPVDAELLLQRAIHGKKFPYTPAASLAWLDSMLVFYGNTVSLASLKGPARDAATRIALLVHNDYTIAAQMANRLSRLQNVFGADHARYLDNLVTNLTEPSHDMVEIGITNRMIETASASLKPVSPMVKPFAVWALRAYAYDDDVAIDAALTGMCAASLTPNDRSIVESAILAVRFDPRRDYQRIPAAPR